MNKAIGIITVFLCCVNLSLSAQHEYDNWYFGRRCGIRFVNGIPEIDTSNNVISYEWSACMSNRFTGKLLFYTNGRTVWNSKHSIMDNGSNITYHQRLSYSSYPLIIPNPADTNQYYIISKSVDSITYSVVDISLNGGLGKVVSYNNYLFKGSYADMTAVRHGTENAYWLISRHHNSGLDTFSCFKISVTGISNPVFNIFKNSNSYPGLIFSNRTGDQLLRYNYFGSIISIYTFNKICGEMSDPYLLNLEKYGQIQNGLAFSGNNKFLYIPFQGQTSRIVQVNEDYSVFNTVAETDKYHFEDIELGPNNKIYITTAENSRGPISVIDVIEYPDKEAPACGFKSNVLVMPRYRNINYQFPEFINDTLEPGNYTINPFIKFSPTCFEDTTFFQAGKLPPSDSVVWDFGDTLTVSDTDTALQTKYRYNASGFYTVSLKWYTCGGIKGTVTKQVYIQKQLYMNLGPDTVLCHKESVLLKSNITGDYYLWNDSSKTANININKPGTYWLSVNKGACNAIDTIQVKQLPPILIDLGGDYTICDDDNELIKLDAGKGFDHYKWTPTGDTTQWIIVKKAGDYFVVVEDFRGCKGDDGSRVNRLCDFSFYMPNSFTPDGNGLNDIFMPTFSDISDYRIEIFNRWGELVFESSDPLSGWDGNFKNSSCPAGLYIWKVSYKGFHNKLFKNFNNKGVVNLIR